MRSIALAFALLVAAPAFACDAVPAQLNVKSLKGEMKMITGNYTVKIDFVDLDNAECKPSRDGSSFEMVEPAHITIMNDAGKVVQSWDGQMTVALQQFFIGKPTNMANAGMIVSFTAKDEVIMNMDRAFMKATVVR